MIPDLLKLQFFGADGPRVARKKHIGHRKDFYSLFRKAALTPHTSDPNRRVWIDTCL